MTNEEIIAGNKSIAKFMETIYHLKYKIPIDCDTDLYCYDFELKYHSSWEWLMTVVEKIANLPNHLHPDGLFSKLVKVNINVSDKVITIADVYKANNLFTANDNYATNDGDEWCPFIEKYDEIFINAVWLACLEFIKWYNAQKA